MRNVWRRPRFWLTLALLTLTAAVLFPVYAEYFINPPWAVSRLPERIKLLKPGMTEDQTWQTLGVKPAGGEGEGPLEHHWEGHPMGWFGYNVFLTMDCRKPGKSLVRTQLFAHGKEISPRPQ